ncbi:alpha-2-macroglobulin family protein [Chitinophaga arvensicola]|uniref:MG2 domain-containing protein n=1 Tax=Chitinophaga arvensicola TaxID=29529 RepID=A0A1I0NGA2_9BACT|nr:alpha-2-macroglobulin family protein [Chitinophaga arvensicola]SEW00294.1 MG2 domain-containing protein [Chitinophaga arvensicola]
MRLFIGIFIVLIFSSNKMMAQYNYDNSWKKIASLEEKGLPKSALEVANEVYAQAVKDKATAQQIKALIFQMKYNAQINDSSSLQNMATMDQRITAATGAQKAILQSIKAEMLLRYFQNNRYKFYNRTAIANDNGADVTTWGSDRLHQEITAAYEASLSDRSLLEKTSLTAFDPIIIKGNTRALRPTLYDLLAHRALEYFKSGEAALTNPVNQFELTDPAVFAPAARFAAHHFTTADSASLQYHALLILQELIRLHEGDKAALLDIDLERISFVNQVAVMEDKETLYLEALNQMEAAYTGQPEVTSVMALQASHYMQQRSANGEEKGDAMKKAKAICEKAVALAPASAGGVSCAYMLDQILHKSTTLLTESVNVPALPFRTLVKYKNVNKIYLRIVPVDETFLKALQKAQSNYSNSENTYWKMIVSRPALKSWEQVLPDPQDYIDHKAEIKIDALPVGHYMLLSSVDPGFSLKNNPVAMQLTWVSNISYIQNDTLYYALNRSTGQPLAGITVQVMKNNNNREEWVLAQSLNTGKDGSVKVPKMKQNNYLRLYWKDGKDELYKDDYRYYYNYNRETPPETQTFLFTDRSIYRPGQIVYYKGIVLKKRTEGTQSDLLVNHKSTLSLYDTNGEKVDSIKITTNEFGSYSGKFTLPEGRMNGTYSLRDEPGNGYLSLQVEEYKRPKFQVTFDTVKNSYRIGDTVTANGKALAFAGNNIDGAKVVYRVERQVRYPYSWLFYKIGVPRGTSREISHGETITDANGNFQVKFPALNDKTVDPASKPVFTYVVHADVTDLNGETRSSDQSISVGYQLLEIGIDIADRVDKEQVKYIGITTRNLNGAFEPATLTVQIKPLTPNKRLLRPRYWDKPDQFVMDEASYIRAFPVDIYKDEDDRLTWPRQTAVLKETVQGNPEGKVALDLKKLPAGFYELEVSAKDKNNEPVVQKSTFELIDVNAKTLAAPAYIWLSTEGTIGEPGKTSTVLLGTSANDVHVIQTKKTVPVKETLSSLELNGVKKMEFPITESERGGIGVNYVFVKDNRIFTANANITVAWDNKELQVKLGTHRDKLLPGEKEKWTAQISGYKNEKVAAEMLASMYDASLDEFVTHNWALPYIYPSTYAVTAFGGRDNFKMEESRLWYDEEGKSHITVDKSYEGLDLFDWNMSDGNWMGRPMAAGGLMRKKGVVAMAQARADVMYEAAPAPAMMDNKEVMTVGLFDSTRADEMHPPAAPNEGSAPSIRKNFQETAFFLPDLRTDKDGNITFEFTIPEALTKWNFQGLAHTKDLSFGYTSASIVTQKPLMVQPNTPRFVREGDKMEFTAKVSNLSDSQLIGQAHLELLDAVTLQPVDGWFQNIFPVQHFTAQAGQSALVSFPIQIPHGFQSVLIYRVTAQAGNFSDGEENALPVLTNRMLVTESLPLPVRGDGKNDFSFGKLLHSDSSQTLVQHGVTVEYTSNPAWYAVQALPYLMEFPYECAEQVFNRFYANALASHITNVTPGLKAIFEKWKISDTTALQSNLQKNEELKSVLLQQTPWVMEAKDEAEQKKNIALLFDLKRMQKERNAALLQLGDKQLPNGAFPWFTGMWEDRFLTQYIVAGLGHLQQLTGEDDVTATAMANRAMDYLDIQLDKDYHALVKAKADLKAQQISQIQIHYLYARSFFNRPVPTAMKKSFDYFLAQQQKYWTKQSKYAQGMIALSLFKKGDKITPVAILKSLKENAMNTKEMGMYWKDVTSGYSWYQAPIETQALLIEAFQVVGKDADAVAGMKTWLLKNKQTNNWHTTKSTADACYAMLLQGSNWLAATPEVVVQLGSTTIKPATTEAGTGYFKEKIAAKAVKADMGNISVTVTGSKGQPSWGAVYWQYFEDLDKITAAATPLVLEKELFKEVNSDKGPVLTRINDGNELKVGDKVKVRVVLKADRPMEYIHLKDMRAACFEPTNVISSSKWQDGLSYYESTRDASTDFFFSYLPKGTHVFEYTLFVTHQGKFSNGISIAECMYAPEFSAHSAGLNVKVTE